MMFSKQLQSVVQRQAAKGGNTVAYGRGSLRMWAKEANAIAAAVQRSQFASETEMSKKGSKPMDQKVMMAHRMESVMKVAMNSKSLERIGRRMYSSTPTEEKEEPAPQRYQRQRLYKDGLPVEKPSPWKEWRKKRKQNSGNSSTDEWTMESIVKDPLRKTSIMSWVVFTLIFVFGINYLADFPQKYWTTDQFLDDLEETFNNPQFGQTMYRVMMSCLLSIPFGGADCPQAEEVVSAFMIGLFSGDRMVESFCLNMLKEMTVEKRIAKVIANMMPWDELQERIIAIDEEPNRTMALSLIHNISMHKEFAPALYDHNVMAILRVALKSENADVRNRAAYLAAVLARDTSTATKLAEDIPQLYHVHKLSKTEHKQIYNVTSEAISNIINSQMTDEEKIKLTEFTKEIPYDTLVEMFKYKRTPPESENFAFVRNAIVTFLVGGLWGGIRWTVFRENLNHKTLRVRVPLTAAGSLALFLVGHFESLFVGKKKTKFEKEVVQPLTTTASAAALFAVFTFAPYCLIPNLAPGIFEYLLQSHKDPLGDGQYDEINKPEKQSLFRQWFPDLAGADEPEQPYQPRVKFVLPPKKFIPPPLSKIDALDDELENKPKVEPPTPVHLKKDKEDQ